MTNNKVLDYLYHNKNNPFTKKTKVIIFEPKAKDVSLDNDLDNVINNVLKEVYSNIVIIKDNSSYIGFISSKYDVDIHNLFTMISDDLGYEIITHDGIYINQQTKKEDILNYIEIYHRANKIVSMDLADMVLNAQDEDYFKLLDIIKRSNFTYIYKDMQTIDIIEGLLKNNLNVLQTSKVLYLHRNSILNKIESIYKETGLNIQKLSNAFLIKQLMIRKNK